MVMAQIFIKQEIDETVPKSALPQSKFKKQYCRLCLSSDVTEFKQLFSPFNTTQSIVDVLKDFAKILILEGDKHSKLICFNCYTKLSECQNFRYLIENSDFTLRNQKEPLESFTGDENNGQGKINVEEIDLKPEIINSDRDLSEDGYKSLGLLNNNETNYSQRQLKSDRAPELIEKSAEEPKNTKRRVKKDYYLKCRECDLVFKRHEPFKIHIISHSGVYPLYCSFCNKGCVTQSQLKIHEIKHTKERSKQCEKCGKKYKQASSLITHRKTHEEANEFECHQCFKKYKSKNSLTVHLVSMHPKITELTEFICEICNKTYPTKYKFDKHMKHCHRQREQKNCEICGKSVSNYSEHLKVHVKPYKCKICCRSFSNSKALKGHSTVHTGEKLYPCDICSKTFVFSSTLSAHKRIHDLTKRLKCEYCDQLFVHNYILKKHVERAHRKGK